ncbi:MAG: hypothetical protein V1727_04995 [Candidatus Omnitrophota bacterium]
MKKLLKILLGLTLFIVLLISAVFLYANFVYLPRLVASQAPQFLSEKTKGQIKADTIEYVPLKGIRLINISVLSKEKQPLFNIDKLFFKVSPLALLTKKVVDFRLDAYPAKAKRPFIVNGLYHWETQTLDLDFKIAHQFFTQPETIEGTLSLQKEGPAEKYALDFALASPNLKAEGIFSFEQKDLHIQTLNVSLAGSTLEFIGDIQDIPQATLNIYGDITIDFNSLKNINPRYLKINEKSLPNGQAQGTFFVSGTLDNPAAGLKLNAPQLTISKVLLTDFALEAQLKNKKAILTKCYARVSDGEVNIDAVSDFSQKKFPASVNINIFNLDLHKLLTDLTGKERPFYGRVFSLGHFNLPLAAYKDVEGKLWLSASGTNILRFRAFEQLSKILRFSEKDQAGFKEASGNFLVAKRNLSSEDFTVSSDNVKLIFKGYMDFTGNLDVSVIPNFSQNFLTSAPNMGNILGILIDSTGNFLGEIRWQGNVKDSHFSFMPLAIKNIFQGGFSEELLKFLPFKKQNEENQ